MVIVVFEFEPDDSLKGRYFELAAILLKEVEKIDGLYRWNDSRVSVTQVAMSHFQLGRTWRLLTAGVNNSITLKRRMKQNRASCFLTIGFV